MSTTRYIINPAGYGGLGLQVWERFKTAWPEAIDDGQTAFTEHAGHARTLATEAPTCDLIVVAGGDGTIGEVISGIMDRPEPRPKLAIIPCGTGNDIARHAGIHTLDDAIQALRDGVSDRYDLIRVERETKGTSEQRHAFLFANAGFSAIPMMRPWMKRVFSPKGAYYFSTLLALLRFRAPRMTLELDGQRFDEPAFLVVVGNAEYAAGGAMRIAPGARTNDGLLNITIVRPLPRHRLLFSLFSHMADGTHVHLPELSYIEGKRLHIKSDPAAFLDLDGEPFGHSPATIAVVPNALELMQHTPQRRIVGLASAHHINHHHHTMQTYEIPSSDGLTLRGFTWPAASPRAVCLLIHGLGEHMGRYDHVGEGFAERGVSLYGMDLRGHGYSDGRRGHTPSYEQLMDDIDLLMSKARAENEGVPLFLYGHSLGGSFVLTYAMKRRPELSGVLVTAPLLRLSFEPPAWKMVTLRFVNAMGWIITLPSGVEDKDLSRDDKVVREKRNDPLSHKKISSRLAADMFEQGRWLLDHAAEFPYPIFLAHGDDDHVTSCDATQQFANALTVDHQLEVLRGLKHEPFNEPEKGDVLELMADWIKGRA